MKLTLQANIFNPIICPHLRSNVYTPYSKSKSPTNTSRSRTPVLMPETAKSQKKDFRRMSIRPRKLLKKKFASLKRKAITPTLDISLQFESKQADAGVGTTNDDFVNIQKPLTAANSLIIPSRRKIRPMVVRIYKQPTDDKVIDQKIRRLIKTQIGKRPISSYHKD